MFTVRTFSPGTMSGPSHVTKGFGLGAVIAMTFCLQIGSALFLLPKQLAAYGLYGLLGWIPAGAGALCICRVFAALALIEKETGGPHVYIQKAFGNSAAFYAAWSYWVFSWFSSLPLFLLMSQSLRDIFGVLTLGQQGLMYLLTLACISLLNMRGATFAGRSEMAFSFIKGIPFVLIPLCVLPLWEGARIAHLPIPSHGVAAMNSATLLMFWGFVGIEGATTLAGNVRNEKRTLPQGLMWGTLGVLALYALNGVMLFGVIPVEVLQTLAAPYSFLMDLWWPGTGVYMSGFVFMVCLGTLNSWTLASAQVGCTAAEVGLFPRFFQKCNMYHSPLYSLMIVVGLLALGLGVMVWGNIGDEYMNFLVNASVGGLMCIYLACSAALLVLIKRAVVPFRMSLWCTGLAACGFCLWVLMSSVTFKELLAMLCFPISGFLMRCFWQRRGAKI